MNIKMTNETEYCLVGLLCYSVSCGKPLAQIDIHQESIPECIKCVEKWGLLYEIQTLSETFSAFFVFRQPKIMKLYKDNQNLSYDSDLYHWVNGTLFGFSIEAILRYME